MYISLFDRYVARALFISSSLNDKEMLSGMIFPYSSFITFHFISVLLSSFINIYKISEIAFTSRSKKEFILIPSAEAIVMKDKFEFEKVSIRLVKEPPILSPIPITSPEEAIDLVGKEIRELLKTSILSNAASMIILHNHP